MSQHWELTKRDYGAVLTILHDWDLDIANQFLSFIEGNFDDDTYQNFIFDLHHVTNIDSMVIGIIISISKRIKKRGGKAILLSPSKMVEQLLLDIGLLSYFEVFDSEDKMIAFFNSNN